MFIFCLGILVFVVIIKIDKCEMFMVMVKDKICLIFCILFDYIFLCINY